jgi:hypothetical protein
VFAGGRGGTPEHVQTTAQTQRISAVEIRNNQVDVFVPERIRLGGEVHLGYIQVEPRKFNARL